MIVRDAGFSSPRAAEPPVQRPKPLEQRIFRDPAAECANDSLRYISHRGIALASPVQPHVNGNFTNTLAEPASRIGETAVTSDVRTA